MLKDDSDSKRGNPLPPHGLLFPISSKVFFRTAPSHNTYTENNTTLYTII